MTILYSYNAALYCEACGERIRAELTAQGKAPPDPDAEDTYDSADFPKSSVSGESDTMNSDSSADGPENSNMGMPDDSDRTSVDSM